MYTCRCSLVFVLAGALAAGLAAPVGAAEPCRALKEQHDRLSREAMQAEIALLHALRQRLCPQQEALATEAHAGATDQATGASQLDYAAYISCREQAEAQLLGSRPLLHRNLAGFTFYTAEGARLARQADGLKPELDRQCITPSP